MQSKGAGKVDVAALEPGDRFELPRGEVLIITGVTAASQAPHDWREGPLYQATVEDGDHSKSLLYRSYHVARALEAGGEYDGSSPVDETEPFWCKGCGRPFQAQERYTLHRDEWVVCSRGCQQEVYKRRRRAEL